MTRIGLALILLLAGPLSAPAQELKTNNFASSQVSVLTTATQVALNRQRASVTVVNMGTNQVCFGSSNTVTLANGVCIPGTVGASITIPYNGQVWGIAQTSATTVSVMDLY